MTNKNLAVCFSPNLYNAKPDIQYANKVIAFVTYALDYRLKNKKR